LLTGLVVFLKALNINCIMKNSIGHTTAFLKESEHIWQDGWQEFKDGRSGDEISNIMMEQKDLQL